MHKQYSRLVQVKASKKDWEATNWESDNSQEHALKLIYTKYKHE